MAKFKKIKLDKRILAKLMLVEYFKDPVFKQLGVMQAEGGGKVEELEKIEKDQWDDIEKLKVWKDDQWFKNWVKNEPKLSGVDLRAYFYFSRESLHISHSQASASLSAEADKTLHNLLSKSNVNRKDAVKNYARINDFEAAEILKMIFSELEQSTEIDKELFASFIEWGGTRELLYADVISYLDSLPASKIKPGFVPRLCQFAKEAGKINEMIGLANTWKQENPKVCELLIKTI